MDRREFSTLLPALLAAAALSPETAVAQQKGDMDHPVKGEPTPGLVSGSTAKGGPPPTIVSGVYTPSPAYGSDPKRKSRRYLSGTLTAGNIQLELHQTTQEPGAPHEPSGTHLHNELWFVKEGVVDLTIEGVTRRMRAGDVGLVCAGEHHYIQNAGDTPCTYFVAALGPPEPAK